MLLHSVYGKLPCVCFKFCLMGTNQLVVLKWPNLKTSVFFFFFIATDLRCSLCHILISHILLTLFLGFLTLSQQSIFSFSFNYWIFTVCLIFLGLAPSHFSLFSYFLGYPSFFFIQTLELLVQFQKTPLFKIDMVFILSKLAQRMQTSFDTESSYQENGRSFH